MKIDTDSTQKEEQPKSHFDIAFGGIKIDDGALHASVLLRDRNDRAAIPTAMTIFSVGEIAELLDGTPDEVNYLVLAKGNDKAIVKISLFSRFKKYNLQFGQQNLLIPKITGEEFQKLKELPESLRQALQKEFDG